jgi:hypothetical protein
VRNEIIRITEEHYAVQVGRQANRQLAQCANRRFSPNQPISSTGRLDRQVRADPDAQIQRRLHMLLLLESRKAESRSAVARHLGVYCNTTAPAQCGAVSDCRRAAAE